MFTFTTYTYVHLCSLLIIVHTYTYNIWYLFTYLLLVSTYPLPCKSACLADQYTTVTSAWGSPLTIPGRQNWSMFLRWIPGLKSKLVSKLNHLFLKTSRVLFCQHLLQLFHGNLRVSRIPHPQQRRLMFIMVAAEASFNTLCWSLSFIVVLQCIAGMARKTQHWWW